MIADIVFLNGQFLPLADAKISPLDRGFLFADGVYEVIPVYSRQPFRLDEHLRRLQASLDGIRLPNPYSHAQWQARVREMIGHAPFADAQIYLQVTRGADVKRDHAFPTGVAPTVFMFAGPLVTPGEPVRTLGVSAVTAVDNRWLRCDLKTLALLANVLLRQQAVDHGCAETILVRDGFVTEGAASNVFLVKNGVLLAPPKSHLMLPGVTYDVVLELAARHGVPTEVRDILADELPEADELWMTSSTKEVLAIATLDGRPVGHGAAAGKPGPLAERMWQWYQQFKNDVMRTGRDD